MKLQGETAESNLLQGAMPRVPAIEPALDAAGKPILSNNVVLPRGTILARDPVANPKLIHEEEILRDGIVVRRTFRRARWNRGQTFPGPPSANSPAAAKALAASPSTRPSTRHQHQLKRERRNRMLERGSGMHWSI